ncbi:MAG: ATP synthase F1 subunit epsilon [Candidatus Ratteibacteria bacterium]|jgi:F-type H+-transporting ATPase subunit epsilon
MKTVSVKIRTPEALILEGDYESAVLPGFEGELGILPGHAALAAQLKPGAIRLKRAGKTEIISITGGFAEVQPAGISVFAEKTTKK